MIGKVSFQSRIAFLYFFMIVYLYIGPASASTTYNRPKNMFFGRQREKSIATPPSNYVLFVGAALAPLFWYHPHKRIRDKKTRAVLVDKRNKAKRQPRNEKGLKEREREREREQAGKRKKIVGSSSLGKTFPPKAIAIRWWLQEQDHLHRSVWDQCHTM